MEKIYSKDSNINVFTIVMIISLVLVLIAMYFSISLSIKRLKNEVLVGTSKEDDMTMAINDTVGSLEGVMDVLENRNESGGLVPSEKRQNISMFMMNMQYTSGSVFLDISENNQINTLDSKYSFFIPDELSVLEFRDVNFDDFLLDDNHNEILYVLTSDVAENYDEMEYFPDLEFVLSHSITMQYLYDLTPETVKRYQEFYLLDDYQKKSTDNLNWNMRQVDRLSEYMYFDQNNGTIWRIIYNQENSIPGHTQSSVCDQHRLYQYRFV